MQKRPSVSVKSTKQELLDAYQEVVNQLEQGQSTPQLTKKFTNTNQQLKSLFSTLISDFNHSLQEKLEDISSQFDAASQTLEQLQQLHTLQNQALSQEKEEVLQKRKREEEEYMYEFEKRKKRQTEELAEQKQKVEAELATKKAELKEQEDEFKQLKTQVATFEAQLNKAVKDAVENKTTELTREFNYQKTLSEQKARSQEELLQQKVSSLENTIKTYQADIQHLQTSLKETNAQLTRIAERAVEKTPPPPTTTKE